MSSVRWNIQPTNPGPRARLEGPRSRAKAKEVADAESEYGKKFRCDTHLIEYYVGIGTQNSRCPMCRLEAVCQEAQAQLLVRENELQVVSNQLNRLKVQVDIQTAMRSAIEALDDNDYTWLKVQMYQYKIDKSVSLKPTHGKLEGGKRIKRGQKMPPNGFMSMPKKGDPEAHLATSFGGLAMAEYLDEAISTAGSAQAMGIMLRAWWKVLPGASE